MNGDMISMTVREQRRLQLLTRVVEGTMTLTVAAEVMGLSLRQARRLQGGLVRDGAARPGPGHRQSRDGLAAPDAPRGGAARRGALSGHLSGVQCPALHRAAGPTGGPPP